MLERLVNQLTAKRSRNRLRASYYDMQNAFRDLGIAIPPNLKNLEVAVGWPAKAVDELAHRVRLLGFVLPGGKIEDFGIPELWDANRMNLVAPQAHVSALIHATSFIATWQGDTSLGEPEIVISAFDAFDATGLWDSNRNGLGSGLVVTGRDPEDQ